MEFQDDYEMLIFDNIFIHYDLVEWPDIERVSVYCRHCEDAVASFDYADIEDISKMDLYELIIDTHRKI